MKKKIMTMILLMFSIAIILTINSCKDEESIGIYQEVYDMAKVTGNFTWFNMSDALLDRSSASGHLQPLLRVRYNSIAASKLDSNGKVKTGTVFPEGSLIVKELYDNATTLGGYAILYKKSGNASADANGWVWGYLDSEGSVIVPASEKGSGCISCHSQADNINYTLMKKYFP